jgi:hypothetical protein
LLFDGVPEHGDREDGHDQRLGIELHRLI